MNTKPIPFELWKNANPDLVESAESCDSCHGKGFEMCNFCKGDGYTITEGDASSTATCRYCKGEGSDLSLQPRLETSDDLTRVIFEVKKIG